ncbi:hypothetical protein [Bradyrhizobium sp. AUGA SZCCT0431]|uniref:hypothetical protein n=1 Tax=Bradyrhizobium sp. AUGA SZCCT0431 TaxID=2807674 RepID=UPI00201128F6|nr:hypothetical protein [Bradyrhizobium sp. AUGA SZCCT0431]
MFTAIAEAGARLKQDRSLRAVVLSGEGSAFCARFDVERTVANFVQHIVWLWRELPVPVIAAVHCIALGGASNSPWC